MKPCVASWGISQKGLIAFQALWARLPGLKLLALLALMIWVGLTEGVGVLLLVPLLGVLSDAGTVPDWVNALLLPLRWLGLQPNVVVLLGFFLLLVGLRSAGQYGRDTLATVLQSDVVDSMRKDCFRSLLRSEWRWVCRQQQAAHANLLLTDVNRIGVGLHFGIGWLASVATGVAWVVTAFLLSWPMTLLALAGGVMLLVATSGQRRAAMQLGISLGQANKDMQVNVQDALQGIRLAKILSSEDRSVDSFASTVQRLRKQQLDFAMGSHRMRSLTHLGAACVLVIFIYLGLSHAHTPIPELLILVLIFARLIPLLINAQQQFHHCLHALPALLDTISIMSECEAHAEPPVEDLVPSWPVIQSVSFEHVTVRYAGREQAVLNSMSLVLPAKTTTVLTGASGSGKSTVADVLMGLMMPDEGVVRIDGQALEPSNRMRWRRSVAYMAQEVFLFHDTIRQNLLLANPQASEVDCVQALKSAAADFVFLLPQGIDTQVGDGGIRLSGGERQRIALARVLLARPSLLILDEATSALDQDNEARVIEALDILRGQVTILVIGHRLSTLDQADKVIKLRHGRVHM